MFGILYLLVFIVFNRIQAQEICIPDHVKNVTLDLNYTLYWEASTNCESTTYLVYIRTDNLLETMFYHTDSTFLNVTFLPACQLFNFEVKALSNDQTSDSVFLTDYVPAPSGADLTITSFNITQEDTDLFLQWKVEEKFAHCARSFRIVIRDEWYLPRDLYTQDTNITIDHLVPCADYEFGIMAIYNVVSEGPIASVHYKYPAANLSISALEGVEAADTYVDLEWSVPPYSANRCPITMFVLDGLPYFRQTYPVQDTPARPPISTKLINLKPDTMYFLRAYAVNSAGYSDPFQIAVQTRPEGMN